MRRSSISFWAMSRLICDHFERLRRGVNRRTEKR
jgi:hypothetical protein